MSTLIIQLLFDCQAGFTHDNIKPSLDKKLSSRVCRRNNSMPNLSATKKLADGTGEPTFFGANLRQSSSGGVR
jgi:hypothetical protein